MNEALTSPVSGSVPGRPLRLGDIAPDFEARTTRGPVRLSDFRGRWLVLFSHPADFTPVCTSEFVALARAQAQFAALDCALLGLSVDSLHSHFAWLAAIEAHFGVEVGFPVIEDPSMAIARAYGMIGAEDPDSSGVRATLFIDPDGIVQAITHYPVRMGRSVPEMLRMVQALQRTSDGDVVAPADWVAGAPLLLPPAAGQDEVRAAGDLWFCRRVAEG